MADNEKKQPGEDFRALHEATKAKKEENEDVEEKKDKEEKDEKEILAQILKEQQAQTEILSNINKNLNDIASSPRLVVIAELMLVLKNQTKVIDKLSEKISKVMDHYNLMAEICLEDFGAECLESNGKSKGKSKGESKGKSKGKSKGESKGKSKGKF